MSDGTYEEAYEEEVFEYDFQGLHRKFASIVYADALGGYEWDEVHVLRGADGYLYVGADSGCSCFSFSAADPETFARVSSWQEAAELVKEWAREENYREYSTRVTVATNLIARLMDKRPPAFHPVDARAPFGLSSAAGGDDDDE